MGNGILPTENSTALNFSYCIYFNNLWVFIEKLCAVTTVTATTISKLIVFLILYLYDHDNINVVYVRQWLPFHASIILSNELAQGSKDKMR